MFWLKSGLFAVGLGMSFVYAIIPPLARDLGLSEIQASFIFSLSAIAWAMTSAPWGRASDKYGRRNIAILGYIGYSISMIILILPIYLADKNILSAAFVFPLLILGRTIYGLLGSATRPASFAYIADITPKNKRTKKFARFESNFLLGTLVGPLLGGYLYLISALAPFIFFSILGIVVATGVFFTLENKPIEVSEIPTSKLSRLAPTVWPYLVFASVLSLCSASLLQSIGFYLTDNFDNLEDITLLISFTFVLLSISTIVSQNMFTSMFYLNNYKLLIYGCLILTASYCVMALSDSIATYFSSIILHGVGLGMVRPANSSGLSIAQQPEYQGEAAGHLGSVLPIGHILTPIVAMPLYIYNSSLLYFASGILCFILFVFIVLHPIFKYRYED